MAITDSTLSYYHYYKRKKKQQSICLSNIAEEIHNLVSKSGRTGLIDEGDQLSLSKFRFPLSIYVS